jgi:hypothetical protein
MKRWLNLKSQASRAFRNSIELGEIEKWQAFAPFVRPISGTGESINVYALK